MKNHVFHCTECQARFGKDISFQVSQETLEAIGGAAATLCPLHREVRRVEFTTPPLKTKGIVHPSGCHCVLCRKRRELIGIIEFPNLAHPYGCYCDECMGEAE